MKEAFLSHGLEDVRLKIPEGKYRVVLLDFWDYTATVLEDFDTLKEAREYAKELAVLAAGDPYTELVIYNDRGQVMQSEAEKGP